MGTKEDNLRIGSEADLEISLGCGRGSGRMFCCAGPRVMKSDSRSSIPIWKAATACGDCWWKAINRAPQKSDPQWSRQRKI